MLHKHDPRGYSTRYDTKKRLASYWHQIDEVHNANPKRVLEIGPGSGFVARQLAPYYNLITMDIAIEQQPICVGSILNLPFRDNAFEAVLCCQVMEHLPFSNFPNCLLELRRIAAKRVILSLPDKKPFFPIQLPGIGRKKIPKPYFQPPRHDFDGQHYWEINAIGYELKKILSEIQNCGFNILKSYQVFENYKHRFIIIETK